MSEKQKKNKTEKKQPRAKEKETKVAGEKNKSTASFGQEDTRHQERGMPMRVPEKVLGQK